MSEENAAEQTVENNEAKDTGLKLQGIYAFKQGMSSVYNDNGEVVPVTVLKYDPMIVSQIKTNDKDGYEAVQVAFKPKKASRGTKADCNHFKAAGFETGAMFAREVRQALPEGVQVGQRVSLESIAKGDTVKVTGRSKGRGFTGVMKRWGHGGGPASHGSHFHRRPGSIGNCEFPGRVMPGRKMPGQYGFETISTPYVEVVEILAEDNVVLVKGSVPGAKNSLVQLMKV